MGDPFPSFGSPRFDALNIFPIPHLPIVNEEWGNARSTKSNKKIMLKNERKSKRVMASFEAIYWALPDVLPQPRREKLAGLAWKGFPPSASASECAEWCLCHPEAYGAALALLRGLHTLGVEVATAAGPEEVSALMSALIVRDPHKALTPAYRERLMACRSDMIALLRFGPAWELTPRELTRLGRQEGHPPYLSQ